MSIAEVNSALVKSYQDLALGLPTAYETRDFTPPTNQPWAQLYNMPAELVMASLGVGGLDRFTGVFQIDLHVPLNTGTKKLLDWADTIRNYYVNGRELTYNGERVLVLKCEPSPIMRPEGGSTYMIAMSVTWTAWLTR